MDLVGGIKRGIFGELMCGRYAWEFAACVTEKPPTDLISIGSGYVCFVILGWIKFWGHREKPYTLDNTFVAYIQAG